MAVYCIRGDTGRPWQCQHTSASSFWPDVPRQVWRSAKSNVDMSVSRSHTTPGPSAHIPSALPRQVLVAIYWARRLMLPMAMKRRALDQWPQAPQSIIKLAVTCLIPHPARWPFLTPRSRASCFYLPPFCPLHPHPRTPTAQDQSGGFMTPLLYNCGHLAFYSKNQSVMTPTASSCSVGSWLHVSFTHPHA